MKNTIKYTLSLALAGTLLWFVFRNIDTAAMLETFKKANYTWIFVSGILTLLAHWSRAYRWKLMLEPLGYQVSTFRTTLAVLLGYFANLVFPRLGEVTRCGSLQKLEGVPFEKSFGAVIAERIVDVLVLLVLLMLNFFLEFDRLKSFFLDLFFSKVEGGNTNKIYLLLGLGTSIMLGLAFVFFNKTLRHKIEESAIFQKIGGMAKGFWSGFMSIKNLKNPLAFVFHTVFIWVMYYFMTYTLFFAIPETANLSMTAGLTVLVVGAIGIAAPTQGGIGAYHLLVGNVLLLYGLSKQTGYTLATFLHTAQSILIVTVLGTTAFIITTFLKNKEI
jgi:glycosyltransferase 2 family protein